MKIRTLRIERLPGIETPYAVDGLGDGVNIICGPNASGKSSLMRALKALRYPEEAVSGTHELSAELKVGAEEVTVLRALDRTRWLDARDAGISPPPLPEHRHVGCYTIGIDDLLSCGGTEQVFSARINRELAGGFDLSQLRALPVYRVGPKAGTSEARALRDAALAFRAVRREQAELREEADQLTVLESEQAALERDRSEHEGYRRALDVVLERSARAQLEQIVGEFDPICAQLSGDELARLNELKTRERTSRAELETAREAGARAEAEAGAAGFPDIDGLPSAEHISALHAQAQHLLALNHRQTQVAERHDQARCQCDSARLSLLGLGSAPDLQPDPEGRVRVTVQEVHDAESALERKRGLDADVRVLESEQALLRSRMSGLPDAERLEAELGELRHRRLQLLQWLRVPVRGAGAGWRDPSRWIALAGGVVAVLALSVWVSVWAVWGLLVPLAAACLWLGADRKLSVQVARLQAGVEATGQGPVRWEQLEVESALEQTEEVLRTVTERSQLAARDGEVAERLEHRRAERDAETAALRTRACSLGLDPMLLDAAFDRWLRISSAHDDAVAALGEAEVSLAQVTEEAGVVSQQLERSLKALDCVSPEGLLNGTRAIERANTIARRVQLATKAHESRERAGEDVVRAEKALDAASQAIADIYRSVGLSVGDESRLSRACDQLERYRGAAQRVRDAQATCTKAENALPDDPALVSYVEQADEVGLRRRVDEAATLDEQLTSVMGRIASIRARVAHATQGAGQEDAAAEHEQALAALEASRTAAEAADLAGMLLDSVENEHAHASRPEVLGAADQLLRRFTRHRFGLAFDADAPSAGFVGYDHARGRQVALAALSVGTRMQLLLALRLAFAAELEAGVEPLPLIVDEALATADPERFEAVAAALGEIAAERQVLYLTAQPHEVGQWEAAGVDVVRIDLAEQRRLGSGTIPWATVDCRLAPRATVPSSVGHSPEAYAALLRVPSFDPWAPAIESHAFHILHDRLPLLESLLRLGLSRIGEVKSFCAGVGASAVLSAEDCESLARRIGWAEHFVSAWREGRGCPVRGADLAESPARPRFFEALSELIETTEGSAARLIEQLEGRAIKGFGAKMQGEFADWLAEAGYVDARPVLSRSERLGRVLSGSKAASGTRPYDLEEVAGTIHWLEAMIELHFSAKIVEDAGPLGSVVPATWTEPNASTR